jgi:phospholipid/cholesterol/gamma-HCH transport system ATP-binding protein
MRKVADSVMFLYNGEAIYFGPVSQLDRCQHPHVQQFLAMDRLQIAGHLVET